MFQPIQPLTQMSASELIAVSVCSTTTSISLPSPSAFYSTSRSLSKTFWVSTWNPKLALAWRLTSARRLLPPCPGFHQPSRFHLQVSQPEFIQLQPEGFASTRKLLPPRLQKAPFRRASQANMNQIYHRGLKDIFEKKSCFEGPVRWTGPPWQPSWKIKSLAPGLKQGLCILLGGIYARSPKTDAEKMSFWGACSSHRPLKTTFFFKYIFEAPMMDLVHVSLWGSVERSFLEAWWKELPGGSKALRLELDELCLAHLKVEAKWLVETRSRWKGPPGVFLVGGNSCGEQRAGWWKGCFWWTASGGRRFSGGGLVFVFVFQQPGSQTRTLWLSGPLDRLNAILSLLQPLDCYRALSAIGSAIGRPLSRPISHPRTGRSPPPPRSNRLGGSTAR